MSRVEQPDRWRCDFCGFDGGVVDDDETIPDRWLSLQARVGAPQLAEEARTPRFLHACPSCAESMLASLHPSTVVDRLRSIWHRAFGALRKVVAKPAFVEVRSGVVTFDPVDEPKAAR